MALPGLAARRTSTRHRPQNHHCPVTPASALSLCLEWASAYDNDSFKDQYPLYFCLLGDDLVIDDERTAWVRLAVTDLDEAVSRPLELYDDLVS